MGIADVIMRLYISERDTRSFGNVRSARLFKSIAVSKCCGSSTAKSGKTGRLICVSCGNQCELRNLNVPRSLSKGSSKDSWSFMHIKASSPSIRPGSHDDQLVRTLDRWLLLEELMHPRPREMSMDQWIQGRLAWECLLHPLCSMEDVIRLGNRHHPDIGIWDEHNVKDLVNRARKVVSTRAIKGQQRILEVLILEV